jgi:hypothetical protein
MINDELHTGFRWYDNILKQNRYKSYCGACDFKLISPCNKLLPFIIITYTIPTSWKIYTKEGVSVLDISSCLSEIGQITTAIGNKYLEYKGTNLSCVYSLDCGYYYSVLSDGDNSLYSEVFYVSPMLEPPLVQIDFPLPVVWPWYNNQLKQNRFKAQCLNHCDYYTISGKTVLPSFQFRRPHVANPVIYWALRSLDGTCEIILDTSLLIITTIGGYDYIEYDQVPISNLECGVFESIISDGIALYYSELVKIVDSDALIPTNFILQESGYRLLQEDLGRLILE